MIKYLNLNEQRRNQWIKIALSKIPAGCRLLDAGAGELKNKVYCNHLEYVSQDFCQYGGTGNGAGLQTGTWNISGIDIVCDITKIPEADKSFDVILCSEVFEHIPDPTRALDEFARLIRPGGTLILTAPFVSLVHFAPYHFCSGFSRYWYEYHLPKRGFEILELSANGDAFDLSRQEIARLGGIARKYGDPLWPVAYMLKLIAEPYFAFRRGRSAQDLGCFGWHCIARKL